MRIYIKNTDNFSYYKGKLVITFESVRGSTIIRRANGDYYTVLTTELEKANEEDINEHLLTNDSLRLTALEEDYIEIGDYNTDDNDYIEYSRSYL